MRLWLFLLLSLPAAPALAQPVVQSAEQALAQDAAEYSARYGVSADEAGLRLRIQEESVAVTERLRVEFRKRLAGISIEHDPAYRIVVLLTGRRPVRDRTFRSGGRAVPIVFRTGAPATEAKIADAIRTRGTELRQALPRARGMGADPRTGELVVMLSESDGRVEDPDGLAARLTEIAGVPARIRMIERQDSNFSIEGGARVEGTDAVTGRRAVCTAGFLVTDGARTGLLTAAHCPDVITYVDDAGARTELPFLGQWGWSFQDVQVNAAGEPGDPLFYVDRARTEARVPVRQRSRSGTRAGDFVCHRGERTGYSCAEVELTDYAPPGELCGGPCAPVWVTVAGPGCGGGDSGGPVFVGTTAFGIMKGGTWVAGGRCAFYYYMSLDYLPDGWSLLTRPSSASPQPRAARPPQPLPTSAPPATSPAAGATEGRE